MFLQGDNLWLAYWLLCGFTVRPPAGSHCCTGWRVEGGERRRWRAGVCMGDQDESQAMGDAQQVGGTRNGVAELPTSEWIWINRKHHLCTTQTLHQFLFPGVIKDFECHIRHPHPGDTTKVQLAFYCLVYCRLDSGNAWAKSKINPDYQPIYWHASSFSTFPPELLCLLVILHLSLLCQSKKLLLESLSKACILKGNSSCPVYGSKEQVRKAVF